MKEFDRLGTRAGFNRAVRHLQSTIYVDEMLGKGLNIADVMHQEINDGNIQSDQALPIVNALLVTKHGFNYRSVNVEKHISDFQAICDTIAQWNTIEVVIGYRHPNLGYMVINAKRLDHWQKIQDIMKDELVVLYCKYIGKEKEEDQIEKITAKAIQGILKLLAGSKVGDESDFMDASIQQRVAAQPAAPTPTAPTEVTGNANQKITPKYSVQVSNELFHNGNVEAWKNIIESYIAQHPGLSVTVYHEGELIQDLNTLFKWGKVKHGGLIFFQVSGDDIKNVAKLKRYLFEGASSRYETFMKKDISRPLKLF